MHKAYSEYKQKILSRLLLSENPKEYRRIIKGENKSGVQHKISLIIFKEHFEKISLENESGNVSDTNDELNNMP